jgi:hypothetical protein
MSYRPFRKISLCLLAACAVSFAVSSLSAQTATAPTVNPSRVDVFLGYSYFGAHGKVQPAGIAYTAVDEGAIGSGAYWFNKYVGGEVLGIANPDGVNDGFYGYYAGPIFRAPMQDFTLFAHGLAGGVQSSGPNNDENGNTPIFYNEPYQWEPACSLAAAWTTTCLGSTTTSVSGCLKQITVTCTSITVRPPRAPRLHQPAI